MTTDLDIGPQSGAFVLGTCLNILLYGVVLYGYYYYAHHCQSDLIWLRLFVAFLFVADSTQTVFSVVRVYKGLVQHFGDISYLMKHGVVFSSNPALTGIISCSVQLFFTNRVRLLSKQMWLAVLIGVLAVISMLFSIASAATTNWPNVVNSPGMHRPLMRALAGVWLGSAVVADVLITFSLVWHLHRKKSGIFETDSLVNQIIRLTIETGILTTTWATLNLTLYLASPSDTSLFFNYCLAKLYTILLMSSLNQRSTRDPTPVKILEMSWRVESDPASASAHNPDTMV